MSDFLQFMGVIGCLLIALFAIGIFWACANESGEKSKEKSYQDWLVKRGLAEWYLDDKNETKWRLLIDRPKSK